MISADPHRGHKGRRSTGNSNPVMTLSAGGAEGGSDNRFRAHPAYTAQLLNLIITELTTSAYDDQSNLPDFED